MNWSDIKHILVLQPENPDGDSIASSLALEEIFGDLGKQVTIYAYVHIPDYLHYIEGADRITDEFPTNFDATIIVDTVTASLLENTLKGAKLAAVSKKPVLILDHHPTENDLPLTGAEFYGGEGAPVSTGEIVYDLAIKEGWSINKTAATRIIESMMADTLGLTTEAVGSENVQVVVNCLKLGASMADIDKRRRQYMKKTQKIIIYKGVLLQRIEFLCNTKLGFIHIPWEETQEFSPHYNPAMLVIEELRNTEGIELSVAIKTYPDGKITGKIRANNFPIAGELAGHFGGGGHDFAAGFKTTDWKYEELKIELVKKASELIEAC